MAQPICAQDVFQALEVSSNLTWVGGRRGAGRIIRAADQVVRPMAGLLNLIHPPRLQILGKEEFQFLDSQEQVVRNALIQQLLGPVTGAILVCNNLVGAQSFKIATDMIEIPLWHTPTTPMVVLEQLADYQRSLEASTLQHGELLEVFGLGVLLTGCSGIGKSELALLVECGVRDHIQRLKGYRTEQDLDARLQHRMSRQPSCA